MRRLAMPQEMLFCTIPHLIFAITLLGFSRMNLLIESIVASTLMMLRIIAALLYGGIRIQVPAAQNGSAFGMALSSRTVPTALRRISAITLNITYLTRKS